MKNRFLYKLTPNVQIGHLYEHLYCHQLAQAFRQQGLFAYVDYSINGKTFYDGYVEIEVIFHSAYSLRCEALVDQLEITIDEDVISGGLLQIMAEKRVDVWERDDKIIEKTLVGLNAEKWQYGRDQVKVAAKSYHQTEEGLAFVEKTQRNFLNITQEISLNPQSILLSKSDVLALFAVVSAAVRENLQDVFARSLFCYSVRDSFSKKGSLLIDRNIYRVDKRQKKIVTEEEIQTVTALIADMKTNGFADRLSQLLNDSSDSSSGTPHQIETLLQASTITLKLGKSSVEVRL